MANTEGNKIWNSTLRRKTPLKAKSPAWKRSQFERTKAPKNKAFYEHAAKSTKRKPSNRLKQVSKKQRAALTKRYFPAQENFLSLPENRYCWICLGRSLWITREEIRAIMVLPIYRGNRILRQMKATITPATEVHHYAGRIGRLLDFVPFFVPECYGCREWPHVNTKQAREIDLLASAAAFNVFPRDKEGELWEHYKNNSSFETKSA